MMVQATKMTVLTPDECQMIQMMLNMKRNVDGFSL
jgi:hypothetical protein